MLYKKFFLKISLEMLHSNMYVLCIVYRIVQNSTSLLSNV